MPQFSVTYVDDSVLEPYENGYYNAPITSGGASAEKEFLEAYEALFRLVGNVIPLAESGESGEVDVVMSKWVDPTRVMPIVVRVASQRLGLVFEPIFSFLDEHPLYAVILDDYPVQIVALPSRSLLIPKSVPDPYLQMLGIK